MLEVSVLKNSDLESVRDYWTRTVVYPTADLDIFTHICASRHDIFGPYVLMVREGMQTIALLVGRLELAHRNFRVGYLRLKGPKLRTLTFIYGGSVGDWNCEITAKVLHHLTSTLDRLEVDLLQFAYLREDSELLLGLGELLDTKSYEHRFAPPLAHWEMTLPGPDRDFLEHLGRKSRYNIRRERRKFLEEFGDSITFRSFLNPEDIGACTRDIEAIAARSYHRAMGVGFVRNAETLTRMQIEAARGRLVVHILYIDGIPVAFWTGVISNDTFFADYTAYRSEYASHEPGKITLFSLLEFLQGIGSVRSVDFGFGDAFYKRQLGSKSWNEVSVTVFGKTTRARWLGKFERTLSFLDKLLRILASKLNVVSGIKKCWRKRFSRMTKTP